MYSGNTTTSEPEQFLISPPTLKRLASQEMALVLYRFRVHHCCEDVELTGDWFSDGFEPEDIIEVIPVISELIKEGIDSVGSSFEYWCLYHESYVFFEGNLHDGILTCIDDFVLDLDGNIGYRNTAKNMIMNDRLDACKKFSLASLYCLVEDVRNMWPIVRDDPMIIEYAMENSRMVEYWVRVMRGESPQYFPFFSDITWESSEYFWNMLSPEEQEVFAQDLFNADEADGSSIKPLLLRLSKSQLRRVLKYSKLDRVLPCNSEKRPYSKMLIVWNYIKYFISPLNFRKLIHRYIELPFNGSALFDIWMNAEDHLRRSFLNDDKAVNGIFLKLHSMEAWASIYDFLCYDMKFFHAVLTELSFDKRNSLWCKYWPDLIIGAKLSYLDEIMKLCFNNDNEIIQFKERDMLDFKKIGHFCKVCFSHGFISELNDYLNYCSSDVQQVASVKRHILQVKRMQSLVFKDKHCYISEEIFIEFDQFVDSAFSNDNDARQYKKQLRRSHEKLNEAWKRSDKTELGVSWT